MEKDVKDLLDIFNESGKAAAQKHFQLIIKHEKLTIGEASALSNKFAELRRADYEAGLKLAIEKDASKNPVPLSKRAQATRAAKLYSEFTGHDALEQVAIDKPVLPDVMSVIGDIDEIFYTTKRDGVIEKYRHKFKKNCRPLFCVSPDGEQIHLIGGSYDFTERGIVDRP